MLRVLIFFIWVSDYTGRNAVFLSSVWGHLRIFKHILAFDQVWSCLNERKNGLVFYICSVKLYHKQFFDAKHAKHTVNSNSGKTDSQDNK
jgi:hypothetical protein